MKYSLYIFRIFDRNDRTNRENFIHSMVAMSLMRYPYYDNPANYLQNKTAYILNNSELDKLMQKVNSFFILISDFGTVL